MSNFTRLFLAAVLVACIFQSCKLGVDPRVTTGDIYVTVYSYTGGNSGKVAKANVYTKPQSVQGVTDEFGSVLLKSVTPGTYEVFASLSGFGSGKAVTTIKRDTLTRVDIYLEQGVSTGIAPEVKLVLPALPAAFSADTKINFSADIQDQDSAPTDISVKWESSIDGVFHTSAPNQDGNVAFAANLSKGLHTITVTATDKDKYTGSYSFALSTMAPKAVELVSAARKESNILLTWKKYAGDDFQSYEIYRTEELNSSNAVLAGSVSDINALTFEDTTPPFTARVYYSVRVVTKSGEWSNSNSIAVENPAGPVFYFTPSDVVIHPTLNRLYMVDKGANKLRVIDFDSYTEIASVALQGTPGYIDIGDNGFGTEVYVPSSDGWIYTYDADKLTLKKSINTGLVTPCVVTNGHGYLAASVMPSPWWDSPVRTYSRSTGIHISGNGDFDGDRLRFVPGQERMISISRSVSPTDMEYYELNKNGEILRHVDDTQHGSYPLNADIFRISKSGDYLITGGEGAVYLTAQSMEYKGQIQRGSLLFSDFAFSDDGKTIYAATQNRKSIQIAQYPQLTRDNEILLRGNPRFVFYRNGRLIITSVVNEESNRFGIEIVKVN